MKCKAIRQNDEIQCVQGITWTVKDDDPPSCLNAAECPYGKPGDIKHPDEDTLAYSITEKGVTKSYNKYGEQISGRADKGGKKSRGRI